MTREHIERILKDALSLLANEQPELLELSVTERALSHHLAIYIMEYFPGYHVDVEYNRDGYDPKRLDLPPKTVLMDETRAVTVYPDIIIHRRNTADNLLVLEMKKPGGDIRYDRLKLEAFKRELSYQHAAHVVLGPNTQEITWVD